jgi:hypothetical protein
MEDELLCQKKVLSMCSFFEENFKLRVFWWNINEK